jgi:hypothetical protein
VLQRYIPGQIGRFDDSFNLNCIEILQAMGVPTYCLRQDILRVIIKGNNEEIYFLSINFKFYHIKRKRYIVSNGIGKYLNIPQNKVAFYDFYIKNVKLNYDGVEKLRICCTIQRGVN